MSKKTWAKLIVIVLLLAAIATGLYLRWRPTGYEARWGTGKLGTSERMYFTNRMNRLVEDWRQTAMRADRGKDARMTESYRAFLVIDTNEQAAWIEDDGQIHELTHVRFPVGMKWKLYHSAPQSNTELPPRTILKIRGLNTNQLTPELFSLVGTGRGIGHINCNFSCGWHGTTHGPGPFTIQPYRSGPSDKIKNPYGSLIVSDAEYEQRRNSLASTTSQQTIKTQIQVSLERNMTEWLKAEKLLYMEIDRQVRDAGLELRALEVMPGPDFSAAHAVLRANCSILREILGGYLSAQPYLRIDYLGNSTWYAKSGAQPQHTTIPVPPSYQLDLEFLVCTTAEIPDRQRSELIKKGRNIQQPVPNASSKWKATLPGGVTVEFIGICENPSAGKQWWGPDGSPLDHVPYINTEPYDRPREDRKIYEIAWRVKMPPGPGGQRHSLEGAMGSYHRQVQDRYGNWIRGHFDASGYSFDKSRQKTSMTLGARVDGGDFQYVKFSNISLVPSKDQGFKIELEQQQD